MAIITTALTIGGEDVHGPLDERSAHLRNRFKRGAVLDYMPEGASENAKDATMTGLRGSVSRELGFLALASYGLILLRFSPLV